MKQLIVNLHRRGFLNHISIDTILYFAPRILFLNYSSKLVNPGGGIANILL